MSVQFRRLLIVAALLGLSVLGLAACNNTGVPSCTNGVKEATYEPELKHFVCYPPEGKK